MFEVKDYDPLEENDIEGLPYLYQPGHLRYSREYYVNRVFENKSFSVYSNKKRLAVCIMTESFEQDQKFLDAYGAPFLYWLPEAMDVGREQLDAYCTQLISEIIDKHPDSHISYHNRNAAEIDKISELLLKKGGSILCNWHSVIDLAVDISTLKRNLRSSYKSLINKYLPILNPTCLDDKNCTWDDVLAFRKLHMEEAGRETRSIKTWEEQFHQIQSGEAYIIHSRLNGELVGASFILKSKEECCYGVGAYKRSLFPMPISHVNLWKAIVCAKEISCRYFDVGQIHFPYMKPTVSEKEYNIGFFKSGFGGKIIPRFYVHFVPT